MYDVIQGSGWHEWPKRPQCDVVLGQGRKIRVRKDWVDAEDYWEKAEIYLQYLDEIKQYFWNLGVIATTAFLRSGRSGLEAGEGRCHLKEDIKHSAPFWCLEFGYHLETVISF